MSADDLLTKDERDALLQGIGRHDRSQRASEAALDDITPYELVSPENVITPIMPLLDTVVERLGHHLQIALSDVLRREVVLQAAAPQIRGHGEFITALKAPVSISIIGLPPLAGPGLLVMEQQLVFTLVDAFFGGKGEPPPARKTADDDSQTAQRDFTAVESRLIQRLRRIVFDTLTVAWQPYLALCGQALGHESNPQFVTAIDQNSTLVLIDLQLALRQPNAAADAAAASEPEADAEETDTDDGGNADTDQDMAPLSGAVGRIYLALPGSMFEPVRAELIGNVKEHPNHNERLTRLLGEGIKDSPVVVRGLLAETELTLRDLLALQVGDYIPMDIPQQALLDAEGIALYRGRYGQFQGYRSIKIERVLNAGQILQQEQTPS